MKKQNAREACTILMPVRNGEKFIRNSLENLLDLANPQDELLVIDDGSTDATLEILNQLKILDRRVRVKSIPALGLVSALNEGVKISSHELIARADVDDRYAINRLDKQIELMGTDSDIGAIFSDYVIFSEFHNRIRYIPAGITQEATELSLVGAYRTAHPSVLFRKSAIIHVGGYKSSEFPAEDLGLWIRMARSYRIVAVPEPLLFYRSNEQGITQSRQSDMLLKKRQLLSTLNYRDLLARNFDTYTLLKKKYKSISYGNERLALHNIDLLLCIKRSSFSWFKEFRLELRVAGRFASPPVTLGLVRLMYQKFRFHFY